MSSQTCSQARLNKCNATSIVIIYDQDNKASMPRGFGVKEKLGMFCLAHQPIKVVFLFVSIS